MLTIGFRNLHLIGTEWTIFRKVEDTLELHSRPGWASSATPRRDIDLNHCAAAGLSPRQVAVQFMSQRYASSQCAVRAACVVFLFCPASISHKSHWPPAHAQAKLWRSMVHVLSLWQQSRMLLTRRRSPYWTSRKAQRSFLLSSRRSISTGKSLRRKSVVRSSADNMMNMPPCLHAEWKSCGAAFNSCSLRLAECWKYALKANQIQKQQVQLLQGPTLAPCPPPHSPPGPTKISPNLSTVSSSTPLSTTPTKRCRWNDSESAEPTRFKGARTDSPRTAQATPVDGRRAHPKGIDRVSRPEHEEDRHKAVRPSPQGRSSGPVATKDALPGPPSPESLEEGELRSP